MVDGQHFAEPSAADSKQLTAKWRIPRRWQSAASDRPCRCCSCSKGFVIAADRFAVADHRWGGSQRSLSLNSRDPSSNLRDRLVRRKPLRLALDGKSSLEPVSFVLSR